MPMPTGIRQAAQRSTKALKNNTNQRPDTFERKLSAELRPTIMDIFHHKEKRNSLAGIGRSNSPAKGSPKNSPKLGPAKPAKLIVDMESPPLVFYGTTANSTGALLSGQLLLTVTDPEIKLARLEMVLIGRITYRKPVAKDCPDCHHRDTELFKWKFLTEPVKYKQGGHTFPFSYLLPGHIPASAHGHLGDIEYVLDAKALTSMSDTISVCRTLTVQRALQPGSDKISNRIFPPTNLNARVTLPSAVHPIGKFPIQMQMTGVIDNSLHNIEKRWRIRRLNWRIDEQSKIVATACSRHTSKVGGEGKGVLREETRSIGSEDIKSGWKTDFDTAGGSIDFEFDAAINPSYNAICDVASPTGFEVSHILVLEIIVAEEQTAGVGKNAAMPTGSARVLRMQFKLTVTDRAGMGISWDEEMPPMYEDVPGSPPEYAKMDDFEGDLGSDEELERMRG